MEKLSAKRRTVSEEADFRELQYLRRIAERNAAQILRLDLESMVTHNELEQKRKGFALLAELSVSLRNRANHESIFTPIARRINAALNMQRTALLVPGEGGFFKASVLQGYPKEEMELILRRGIEVDEELLNPEPTLVTGADSPERLADFREAVKIPFMISSPTVLYDGTVAAILVTGRTVELPPHYSRLEPGDAETVQAISSLLAAVLVEKRLEDDLRSARDLAEKSSRAKGEFLANMSHEIHTPMNAIIGMVRMLSRSELTGEQRRNAEHISQSTRLLLRVFNDILDFTNFDAGRVELRVSRFSIRDMADRVRSLLEDRLGKKSISFNMRVEPDVPDVILGDPERVEQVLFNMADNSVKFTDKGRVSVRISHLGIGPEEVHLMFEIKDTGIGMSEEEIAGIFTAFSQGDASYTRKHGGTGLGLAICGKIASLMRGELKCESLLGKGSKFTFSARFALPESAERRGSGKRASEPDDLRGMRVLLVEDNEINQLVTVDMLDSVGVISSVAVNGLEALRALENGEYDLVLMDIQMPEMDGLTAARHIRANPKYKDLPVVALTAHALPEDRKASLESGMNDHITKPVEPEQLSSVLRQWLTRGKQGASPLT